MVTRSREYIGNVIMPDTTAWSALRRVEQNQKRSGEGDFNTAPTTEILDDLLEKLRQREVGPKTLRKMYKAYSTGRIR